MLPGVDGCSCLQRWSSCPACNTPLRICELDEHVRATCIFKPTACELCNLPVTFAEKADHALHCRMRPLACGGCKGVYRAHEFELHKANSCPARTVTCEACGISVAARDLDTHHARLCEQRVLPCPLCQQKVLAAAIDAHQRSCEHRVVTCRWCHSVCKSYEVLAHEATCAERYVNCELCSASMPAFQLDVHTSAVCPKRTLACQFCALPIEACALAVHEHACEERPFPCQHCTGIFQRRHLSAHESSQCAERLVRCSDCGASMRAWKLPMHESDACPRRLLHCKHGCGTSCFADELRQHEAKCELAPTACVLCHIVMPREQLASHNAWHCDQRQVKCPRCKLSVTFSEKEWHMDERCMLRPIDCLTCRRVIPANEFVEHGFLCDQRLVPCKFCARAYSALAIEIHQNCECPARLVECSGCSAKMAHIELESHSRLCDARIVACGNCRHECRAVDLFDHLEICPDRQLSCRYCGCTVLAKCAPHHEEIECPKRPTACDFCSVVVPYCDHMAHLHTCPNRPRRCEWCDATVAHLDKHQEVCGSRPAICKFCSLDTNVTLIASHMSSCELRPIPCRFCEEPIMSCRLATHEPSCSSRHVECLECRQRVTIGQLNQHVRELCPNRSVACTYGCSSTVQANQLEMHQATCDSRIVPCAYCGALCVSKALQSHQLSCPDQPVDARRSEVYGPGLCEVRANVPTHFEVTLRSATGAAVRSEALAVVVRTLPSRNEVPVKCEPLAGAGCFRFMYTPPAPGKLYVTVMHTAKSLHSGRVSHAAPVQEGEWFPHAVSGPLFGPLCTAFGEGLRAARAGESAQFTIEARDEFGFACGTAAALHLFRVTVHHESDGTHVLGELCAEGGKLVARYTPQTHGLLSVHIAVLDESLSSPTPIRESPFQLRCEPHRLLQVRSALPPLGPHCLARTHFPSALLPSHPIPSHPIPSHPIPSHPIPSHPILFVCALARRLLCGSNAAPAIATVVVCS